MNFTKRFFLLFFYIFTCQLFVPQQTVTNDFDPEPFGIMLDFYQVGNKSFTALYDHNTDVLLLPVKEIFDFLKINNQFVENGKILAGFLEHEKNTFLINVDSITINYRNTTYQGKQHEIISDMGILYVSSNVLEQELKFNIKFDFRSLSAKISADFDFPIVKQTRLENARANLKRINGEIAYDDTLGREKHLLKFGMIDWSLTSMQGVINENRAGLGIGMELAGGELSGWFNYSDVYDFNRNLQRYYWRWVNNDAKFARQLQIGRVYNTSISTLLYPVDGITITNTPSSIRKSLGEYLLSDYTEPDWMVELYLNNILVDYTTADASGYFRFNVPVTFGTTNITLRFYGPNGEERSEEKRFNMPYNFLPKGELEYRVTGGHVLDPQNSLYGKAEVSYGVTRGLTVGGGMEYSQSIAGNPQNIPFLSASMQPLPQLIFIAEYAHNVRTKATLNYTLPKHTILELNYSIYQKDQTAIIFNYLEERYARFSVPFLTKKVSGFVKGSFRQLIYPNFSYNSGENVISGYHGRMNVNLGNYISWTNFSSPNIFTNLSTGYRMPRNMNIRLSGQYNHSIKNTVYYKAEVEKQISNKGLLTVGYENNIQTNFHGVNISFRYDLSFMTSFASASYANKRLMSSQNLRGSVAFGSGNKYVHTDKNHAVGRSGISVIPFVDINHNGVYDEDEPIAEKLSVRCNGGQLIYRDKDNIIRINGLEPFISYALIIDELGFDQLSWQVKNKIIKVTTDPNQFKHIYIPVSPMGEVYGNVIDESGSGVGRILVNLFNDNDSLISSFQSESDGYFSYLGLIPGNYTLRVDSLQLAILNMTANEKSITVKPSIDGDIVNAGDIVLIKVPELSADTTSLSLESTTEELLKTQKSIDYPVLFDFDKAEIKQENYAFLQNLASILEHNPCMSIRIEAHTDSDGPDSYNQKLSERRAYAVKRFLVERGINGNRLETIGYGETRPLNNNTNKAEKAQNRRATFVVTSEEDCLPDEGVSANELVSSGERKIQTLSSNGVSVDSNVKDWLSDYQFLFNFDKSEIRTAEYQSLNNLVSLMKQNPAISIAIEGHTDNDGPDSYNMKLSLKRAHFIMNYLVKNGIESERLMVKGYGATRPLNGNSNIYEKALNRRVSFRIIT